MLLNPLKQANGLGDIRHVDLFVHKGFLSVVGVDSATVAGRASFVESAPVTLKGGV
jgi:hypothetical protein